MYFSGERVPGLFRHFGLASTFFVGGLILSFFIAFSGGWEDLASARIQYTE